MDIPLPYIYKIHGFSGTVPSRNHYVQGVHESELKNDCESGQFHFDFLLHFFLNHRYIFAKCEKSYLHHIDNRLA